MRSRFPAFVLLAATAGAVACNDPTALRASLETVRDTLVVYSVNGSPPALPSALNTATRQVMRAGDDVSFDVAFDAESEQRVLLIPARVLTGRLGTDRPVGIRVVTESFDALAEAPSGGYVYDSATVVAPGQTAVVQAYTGYCALNFSKQIYSKLVVDSVRAHTIYFRIHVDPNCGFRSFAPGIPQI